MSVDAKEKREALYSNPTDISFASTLTERRYIHFSFYPNTFPKGQ